MTELDPRFDPRFQRGYVPGSGEEDPRADASPALGTAERAAVAPRIPESAAADPVPPAPGVESDAHAQPRAEAASAGDPGAAEGGRMRRWLWAAFAVCGIALVAGVAAAWVSVYRDESYFAGPVPPGAWEELRWLVAPGLIEAGVLGALALAVWLGVRGAARGESLRSAPVIGLASIAAAAVLLLLWTGTGPTTNTVYATDPAGWGEEERREAALAVLRSVLAPIAVRVGVFAVLGILVIGARSAIAGRAEPAEPPAAPASAGDADGERGGIDAEVR
ncbi:hypothetical protein ROT00_11840 [Agromyces mediolanus]|uniref:hypothetical protein n=1 Tax=Agromyces mediolanus TaxID=41986 RepID=UPI003837640D